MLKLEVKVIDSMWLQKGEISARYDNCPLLHHEELYCSKQCRREEEVRLSRASVRDLRQNSG